MASKWCFVGWVVIILGSCMNNKVAAQEKFTLSGYVKDANNGETLLGAYVYVLHNTTQGTSTNTYGFYSLTLPKGSYTIEVPEGRYTISYEFLSFKTITLNNFEIKENINIKRIN